MSAQKIASKLLDLFFIKTILFTDISLVLGNNHDTLGNTGSLIQCAKFASECI